MMQILVTAGVEFSVRQMRAIMGAARTLKVRHDCRPIPEAKLLAILQSCILYQGKCKKDMKR